MLPRGRTLERLPTGDVAVRHEGETARPPAAAPAAGAPGTAAGAVLPRVPSSQTAKGMSVTPDELAAFEKHVWRGCFVCVIYLPRNMARCTETIKNVVDHGFPPPYMIPGVTPRAGDTVHDCVCRAHHVATAWFLSKGLDRYFHLMVLEDDARFRFPDAEPRLARALAALEASPGWASLHVGHIPMGPVFPVGVEGLCRSATPCTSHCYLLNRAVVRDVFQTVPERLWKRPLMVEGLWALPAAERFAMCVMPKEMASLPFIKDQCTFEHGEYCTLYVGYLLAAACAAFAVWLVLAAVRWPLRVMQKAAAAADDDDLPPCTLEAVATSAELAAWLACTALALHAFVYVLRRTTCSLAEGRPWRVYALDAARTGLGLGAAAVAEQLFARSAAAGLTGPDAPADHPDSLSVAAGALLLVPFFAWPLSLALHVAVTKLASRHRRLLALSVFGRYSDPLVFTLPGTTSQRLRHTSDAAALESHKGSGAGDRTSLLPAGSLDSAEGSGGVQGPTAQYVANYEPGPEVTPSTAAATVVADAGGGAATDSADGAVANAPPTAVSVVDSDASGAGVSYDALAAFERAVAAEETRAGRRDPPIWLGWWATQAVVWVLCVGAAHASVCLVLAVFHTDGPLPVVAKAIMNLGWPCSKTEAVLCGLCRLIILVIVAAAVDVRLGDSSASQLPADASYTSMAPPQLGPTAASGAIALTVKASDPDGRIQAGEAKVDTEAETEQVPSGPGGSSASAAPNLEMV